MAYRLGRAGASGMLTVDPYYGEPIALVLQQGRLSVPYADGLGRRTAAKLTRIASMPQARWHFDSGLAVYPLRAAERQMSLEAWARRYLESQMNAALALRLERELAGVKLSVRRDLAPDEASCDAADRRILLAMRRPRPLDQIRRLARTPRFRLLSFVHFLRSVGALTLVGVGVGVGQAAQAQPQPEPQPPEVGNGAAYRLLGLSAGADHDTVRRAYKRMARALHPDLHPDASAERRRALEGRLAQINDAYRSLTRGETASVAARRAEAR